MEPICEFCAARRPAVYCPSDAARLCLACDEHVHSANAISRSHTRAPICGRCLSRPASVHCSDEKLALCHDCDLATAAHCSEHRRRPVSCYTGCPAEDELRRLLDCGADACDVPEASELDTCLKFDLNWIGDSSSSVCPNDAHLLFKDTSLRKLGFSDLMEFGLHGTSGVFEGLNSAMEWFCCDSRYEIFGPSIDPLRCTYLDGGNCFLSEKNLSSMVASNASFENAIEGSCLDQHDSHRIQPLQMDATSSALQSMSAGLDQLMSNSNGTSSCIRSNLADENVFPGMPFAAAKLTGDGEGSILDSKSYVASALYPAGESIWNSRIEKTTPQARNAAKLRYKEKKKNRLNC